MSPLLIDGYNLMHAAGVFPRGLGPATLERSRTALLEFLARTIPEEQVPLTTVVFDAFDPPPGLPRQIRFRGLQVRFASPEGEADVLIERLIAAHTAPRRLTVVSSDHRIQRAARRRRATPVDSDVWVRGLREARQQRRSASPPDQPIKPTSPQGTSDVDYWVQEFGFDTDAVAVPELKSPGPRPPAPADKPPESAPPSDATASESAENDPDAMRALPAGPDDVRFWLTQFGFSDETEVRYSLLMEMETPAAKQPPSASEPVPPNTQQGSGRPKPPAQGSSPSKSKSPRKSRKRPKPPELDEDIFPPGFMDDLEM